MLTYSLLTAVADRGLHAVESFVREGGDPYAYVSVDALLVLMNLDGDLSCDTPKLNWKNLIAAIQGSTLFIHYT